MPDVTVSPRRNVPVPDELASVRDEIKRLEEREAVLKAILISDPETRTGAAYLAEVKTTKRTTTDIRKELRACHPDIVEQFTFALDVTRVVLQGVSDDGEIVSVRKLKKAQAEDKQEQAT